jgi:plastocyanin
MKTRIVLASIILSLSFIALLPLASGMVPARASKTWNVSMYGDDMTLEYVFIPANLTISVGDSVNWTSAIGTHTTTSLPNQGEWWDSGSLTPGESFAHTFNAAGTYNYTSLIDPEMYGTIVVQQPAAEFPGSILISALAIAVTMALLLERKLRG